MGPVECRPKLTALLLALAWLLLQVPGGDARSGIRLQRSAGGQARAMREASALAEEKRILLQLKAAVLEAEANVLKLDQWPLGDWNENDQGPCGWPGVACSQASDGGGPHVTGVDISGGGYAGKLPLAFISNLSYVATASFAKNAFSGAVDPDVVASLPSKLTSLDLSVNQLSGPLPSTLGSLPALTKVNVSFNLFTDGIPKDLFTGSACTTSGLRSLDVSSNQQLGGVLPYTLASCPGLSYLDASNCSISGGFPDSVGRLPNLEILALRDNRLAGPIPGSAFAACSSLTSLDVSTNNLTLLPAEIGNCTSLQALSVSANKLTSLPSSLASLAGSLELLIASRNRIAELPQELGSCTKIRVLALDHNALAGGFPAFIARLQSLQFLTLSANSLQGELPAWIGGLGLLRHLDASENSLSGSVPEEITSLSKLQFLLLASNQLGGPIPEDVGDMESLQVLDVSSNQLHGGIPASVGKLARLLWLMLANNQLYGPIPPEIGNCSSLLWLNAMNNSLSGQIPEQLASIGENVNATFNLNTATLPLIPPPMGDCGAVRRWIPSHYPPFDLVTSVMTLERCRLFWNLLMRGVFMYPICPSRPPTESMGYIQLSANRLSGSIPAPIVRGSHLGLLFLDMNNLSGPIPDSGFAGALTGLNLSRNALTGSVPPALGSLTCLVSLDLSSNKLSGRIPGELQNLTQLNRFNISFNPALEGPVPSGRQFSTFGPSVYEGDPRLCSDGAATVSGRSLPTCGPGGSGGSGLANFQHSEAGLPRVTTVVGISLACTLGLVVIVLLGFCLLGKAPVASDAAALEFMMVGGKEHHRQQYIDAAASVQVSLFSVELPKQLTYSDLVAATSNFDESNVVGSGGFGVVYKAKLPDGTTVAIKKLIQEGPQADREFLAEMETLGHLHHDNLVPLLGCSSCGSQKLLVYKFMEKGSLDDWLHERPGGREALEWPLRLNIALGIARGLKFLHHNCSPPVVHRDMKASNILLDDNFEPRLTDFGLARVLGSGGETHVSTVVAGTLGYVPPEYCQTWRATAKGDVYSFGVVLLELATGRRPISNGLADGIGGGGNNAGGGLIDWVAHHVKKGLAAEVCDRVVTRGAAPAEVLAFLRLAVCCTAELPVRRPTMREVLRILEEIKAGNYSGVMLTHQSSKGHG